MSEQTLKVHNVTHTWTERRKGHFQVLARSKEEAEQKAAADREDYKGPVMDIEDEKFEVEEVI